MTDIRLPEDLLALASSAMAHAYAPYSGFRVGAALRGVNGRLYAGCNVENAAYPEGCCAETGAIAAMVADGERRIAEALVVAAGPDLVTPCGGCRQRLREFADETLTVHLCNADGRHRAITLGALLPAAFGPRHIPLAKGTK